MTRLWFLAALAVAVAPSGPAAAPVPATAEARPVVAGQIKPLARLVDDAASLAAKFGRADANKFIDAQLAHALGLDSLKSTGLDLDKPIGFYAFVGDELLKSTAVAMLPVANRQAVLDLLGRFQIKAASLGDDLYSLDIPEETLPVFVRFADGYAYVTTPDKAAIARDRVLPPSRVFTAGETAVATVTARPEATSESFRKSATDQLHLWLKTWIDDLDDDFLSRSLTRAQLTTYKRWTELFLNSGKELKFRIEFDRGPGELSFDVNMTAQPGSPMAQEIATVKPGRSLFTNLVGDAGAINFSVNTHLGDDVAKELAKMLREGKDELMEWVAHDIEDANLKEQIRNLFKSLAPAAEAGEFDSALSLRGPKNGKYQLLYGIRVKDGAKVEAEARKVIAALPEGQRKRVKADAVTVGAVKVHEVVPDADDTVMTKILGKNAAYFALSNDALLIGLGEGAGESVGALLAAASPQPAPAVQLDLSVMQLKDLADAISPGVHDMVKTFFGKDSDRIRLYRGTIEGGDALKARVTVSLHTIAGAMFLTGG